ncbi:MAG TPA: hypothetical protein VNA68_02200 [Candidatus Dormibacteraeota bacterium]|nr:hypothetical protein [Candidatus Dormibacteraeota bacterium]
MSLLLLKIKVSARAVLTILASRYGLAALVMAVIALGVLLWVFNLNLLAYIFASPNLSFIEKVQFVLNGYGSVFTNFDSLGAATILAFSVLFGVNAAVLWYVLVGVGREAAREGGKSGLSLAAAIIGAGCAVCGTGFLGPLLAAVGAGTSVGLIRTIGIAANILAIALSVYSIYGLGKRASALQAKVRSAK